MKKLYLIPTVLAVTLITGCGSENNTSYTPSLTEAQTSYEENVNLSDYLVTSNMSVKDEIGLVSVVGQIENTYTERIEEIGDVTFFDENGGIITSKKMSIKLNPGEIMYFEELVGLSDEVARPKKLKLTGF